MSEKTVMTIAEIAHDLGISVIHAYRVIKASNIPIIKYGKNGTLVGIDDYIKFSKQYKQYRDRAEKFTSRILLSTTPAMSEKIKTKAKENGTTISAYLNFLLKEIV